MCDQLRQTLTTSPIGNYLGRAFGFRFRPNLVEQKKKRMTDKPDRLIIRIFYPALSALTLR